MSIESAVIVASSILDSVDCARGLHRRVHCIGADLEIILQAVALLSICRVTGMTCNSGHRFCATLCTTLSLDVHQQIVQVFLLSLRSISVGWFRQLWQAIMAELGQSCHELPVGRVDDNSLLFLEDCWVAGVVRRQGHDSDLLHLLPAEIRNTLQRQVRLDRLACADTTAVAINDLVL